MSAHELPRNSNLWFSTTTLYPIGAPVLIGSAPRCFGTRNRVSRSNSSARPRWASQQRFAEEVARTAMMSDSVRVASESGLVALKLFRRSLQSGSGGHRRAHKNRAGRFVRLPAIGRYAFGISRVGRGCRDGPAPALTGAVPMLESRPGNRTCLCYEYLLRSHRSVSNSNLLR
jgi:hypothetical protein